MQKVEEEGSQNEKCADFYYSSFVSVYVHSRACMQFPHIFRLTPDLSLYAKAEPLAPSTFYIA